MTFDEYWNSQARRDEIPNDLLSHDIARAAYEAGARGAGAGPASEPKTSAAAGVVCECGHTEAEHGKPGCLYESCLGFRPALEALRAAPAPREPCCDLASRGTHRKGCTGEPMSKQFADLTGREAPLTDAELVALRLLLDWCAAGLDGQRLLKTWDAASIAAVAARAKP